MKLSPKTIMDDPKMEEKLRAFQFSLFTEAKRMEALKAKQILTTVTSSIGALW